MYVYDKIIKVNIVGNFHKHRRIQLQITIAVKGDWPKSRSITLSSLFSISGLHSASPFMNDMLFASNIIKIPGAKLSFVWKISFKIDNDSNTHGVKNINNDTLLPADQEKITTTICNFYFGLTIGQTLYFVVQNVYKICRHGRVLIFPNRWCWGKF